MRLLLIEDDPIIAEALQKGLSHETFAVDVAEDGMEGLASAQAFNYDLLIVDVMLPGKNGLEITRQLREDNIATPILILSAKDNSLDKMAGLNLGADDYLAKPFSFGELLARVRALLRRQVSAVFVLQTGGLVVEPATHTVMRNKQPIKLSAKEFAILEYMLHNKGKVISKDALISHVWDFDADILPHAVEVILMRLRAKIDKPFTDLPLLQTVRGRGYRIRDIS